MILLYVNQVSRVKSSGFWHSACLPTLRNATPFRGHYPWQQRLPKIAVLDLTACFFYRPRVERKTIRVYNRFYSRMTGRMMMMYGYEGLSSSRRIIFKRWRRFTPISSGRNKTFRRIGIKKLKILQNTSSMDHLTYEDEIFKFGHTTRFSSRLDGVSKDRRVLITGQPLQ